MRPRRKAFKGLCWLCIGLALSTCTYELCYAQDLEGETPPDSLNVEIQDLRGTEDLLLFDTPADSLGTDGGQNFRSIARKWWIWALVTTAIAITAVLVGGGEEKKVEEDLPGFPDPPNR